MKEYSDERSRREGIDDMNMRLLLLIIVLGVLVLLKRWGVFGW